MSEVNESGRGFSDDVLSKVPGRALKFLGYIGRTPPVFSVLNNVGFQIADLHDGWALLHAAAGYTQAPRAPVTDPTSAKALAELDAWDEPNLRRLKAAVTRLHPEQVETLFDGIEPGTGTASIMTIATFLDRVDAVAKKTPKVLETLEKRGLKPETRAHLRSLIATAKGVTPAPGPIASGSDPAEYRKTLVALKLWFDDWAESARTSGLNRYHLINLGLASRKTSKSGSGGNEENDADE